MSHIFIPCSQINYDLQDPFHEFQYDLVFPEVILVVE